MNKVIKYFFSKESVFIQVVIFIYLSLSYVPDTGFYVSVTGTVLIVLASFGFLRRDFLRPVGLRFTKTDLWLIPALTAIVILVSYVIIRYLAEQNGFQRNPSLTVLPSWKSIHTVGQTLNEEIVLGFILLLRLRLISFFKDPAVLSIAASLAFTVFHFLFYLLSPFQGAALDWMTLSGIFLIGTVRNNLILRFNHIGYAWAVHYGWNYVMFGGEFYYGETLIREYDVFRFFIGSQQSLILFFLISLVSFAVLLKSRKKPD